MRYLYLLLLLMVSWLGHTQNVDKIEYFIDADPGFGLGINVAITPSNQIDDFNFQVPLSSVSNGFHFLNVRSRDVNGKWSLVSRVFFFKDNPISAGALPNITKIEYFIDTDPGYGLGVNVPFSAATVITDLIFSVDVSALTQGAHKLFVRSRDANNKWSIIQVKDFSVCNQAVPVAAAATSMTTTGFTANWATATGATSYRLDVSADNFATFVSGNNDRSITAGTTATVTGLTIGTAYKYRVRAVNATCTSVSSAAIDVTTLFTAPSATAATLVNATGFRANWNAVTGAASYRIDISADNFSTFVAGYNNKTVATTNEVVTGLAPSTAYKYRVRAVSAGAVISGNSNEITVTTLALPAAPTATAATAITATGFTANWNTVAGATGYRLDVSADNFTTFVSGFSDKTVTTLSDVVTGLTAATAYKYRVRTVNANGTSVNSNVIDVTTSASGTAPAAPVATSATSISVTGFTANWNAVTGATGYQLDISADNFTTFLAGYNSKAVTATTEVVTGLTASTAYKYRVRATNASGTSANSNVVDVTTGAAGTAPTTPVATAATAISSTGFTANWNTVTGATGYQLDISADNFTTFLAGYNSKVVTAITEVVTGLTASTAYKYRVRATNASGTSANSNVVDVTTSSAGTAPTAPVATAATAVSSTGFTANWNTVTGATSYRLDISADNFTTFITGYNSKSVTASTEVVTGLTASTAYKYRVRATNASGTSANSNVVDVTTGAAGTAPTTPVATAATAISSTGFAANWNIVTGAMGYQLDISADNFSTFVAGYNSKVVTATTEVVTGLTASTAYKYRVRATNTSGTSANSNVIDVTTLAKQNQTITFPAIADKTLGGGTFTIGATASSGLAVTYATTSDKITIANGVTTLVKAGRAVITASQAGDATFNAASSVDQSFCIKPAKPTITASGNNTETVTLTSSSAIGNQWFKDGTAISGATNAILSVTAVGVYKVQAKADDCISEFSSDFPIIVTGDLPTTQSGISVSPNPVEEVLEIRGIVGDVKNYELFDLAGRAANIVLEKRTDTYTAPVRHLSQGMYVLRLHVGDQIQQVKFVKK